MSALSVADVLDRAADLIEPEGAWTQGAYARNKKGADVNSEERCQVSPSAVCWCMYGAVAEITAREGIKHVEYGKVPESVDWNDSPIRTQAEVVAKLREAAALARKGEP